MLQNFLCAIFASTKARPSEALFQVHHGGMIWLSLQTLDHAEKCFHLHHKKFCYIDFSLRLLMRVLMPPTRLWFLSLRLPIGLLILSLRLDWCRIRIPIWSGWKSSIIHHLRRKRRVLTRWPMKKWSSSSPNALGMRLDVTKKWPIIVRFGSGESRSLVKLVLMTRKHVCIVIDSSPS